MKLLFKITRFSSTEDFVFPYERNGHKYDSTNRKNNSTVKRIRKIHGVGIQCRSKDGTQCIACDEIMYERASIEVLRLR